MTKIQETLLCAGVFAIMFIVGMQFDFSDQVVAWYFNDNHSVQNAFHAQAAQIRR